MRWLVPAATASSRKLRSWRPRRATSSTTRASNAWRASAMDTKCTIWYTSAMHITDEVDIAAPAEVVWRLTEDIEEWPATTPTVTRVERLDGGPVGVGSRARVEQPGLPAKVWTVTRFERGSRFEWETTI